MNKEFLLEQDLIENRQFKFYSNGVLVQQQNGTNPRIRRLGTEQQLQYAAINETVPEYEVRVVLSNGMNFLLNSVYEIEFSISLRKKYKCVNIIGSNEPGLFVKIILALDNQVA